MTLRLAQAWQERRRERLMGWLGLVRQGGGGSGGSGDARLAAALFVAREQVAAGELGAARLWDRPGGAGVGGARTYGDGRWQGSPRTDRGVRSCLRGGEDGEDGVGSVGDDGTHDCGGGG